MGKQKPKPKAARRFFNMDLSQLSDLQRQETTMTYNDMRKGSDHITLPFIADDNMVEALVAKAFDELKK